MKNVVLHVTRQNELFCAVMMSGSFSSSKIRQIDVHNLVPRYFPKLWRWGCARHFTIGRSNSEINGRYTPLSDPRVGMG